MGGNIIPMLVERGEAQRLRLRATTTCPARTERDRGYWRDVGTLDSFYEAHMDLISVAPGLQPLQQRVADLHRRTTRWPPAKFVHGDEDRLGRAVDSMVSPGAVVSGALVERSVLSPERDGPLLGRRSRARC